MVLYFLLFLHQMPIILLNKFNALTLQRIGTVFCVRYELKRVIKYSFRRDPMMTDIILQAGGKRQIHTGAEVLL